MKMYVTQPICSSLQPGFNWAQTKMLTPENTLEMPMLNYEPSLRQISGKKYNRLQQERLADR